MRCGKAVLAAFAPTDIAAGEAAAVPNTASVAAQHRLGHWLQRTPFPQRQRHGRWARQSEWLVHLHRRAFDAHGVVEMEHAIRLHIRKHPNENLVLSLKLSERLNEISKILADQWDNPSTRAIPAPAAGEGGGQRPQWPAQDALGVRTFRALSALRLVLPSEASALKDRLPELARVDHERLVEMTAGLNRSCVAIWWRRRTAV